MIRKSHIDLRSKWTHKCKKNLFLVETALLGHKIPEMQVSESWEYVLKNYYYICVGFLVFFKHPPWAMVKDKALSYWRSDLIPYGCF